MQLVDIILDKRISCTFIDDTNVENVIFCRPLEESLNNISLITTKDNEFIHNYLEESTGNYLVTNVFLDDGTVYEDVRFRLVTIEEGRELPASTINLSTLGLPSATDVLPPSRLIEEEYNLTLENAEENDDFSVIYDVPEVVDNTEIVQKIKSLESKLVTEQQKLEQEKIKLNKERITLENERRLSKALEDYKAELLQETFLVSNHQKELLEKSIQDLSKSFQEQFDSQQINVEKYLDTLSLANLEEVKKYQDIQVGKIKDQINNLLSERQDENALTTDKLLLERTSELESIFTEKLITELEDHKRNVKTEIDGINNALDNLIGEKLQENNDKVDRLLVNRAGVLQDQFNEKLTKDLTDHKNSLFNEFKTVSTETSSLLFTEKTEELNNALTIVLDEHKKNLNTTVTSKINEIGSTVNNFKTEIDGKLPQLDETIKEINKRIQTLVIEKKNVQVLADDARKYTDTKVAQASEEMMNYARRILDLGGGGGSVAVQFANGGTMNGNLNVTGQYLSGGVDLATIFSGGGGGNTSVNALVISTSANWNTAYAVATTYQNASGSFATNTLLQSTSALLTPLTTTNTLTGSLYSTLQSTSALLTPLTLTNTLTSQLVLNSTLNSLSGNWQSTYTTVSSNSSNWQTGYNNAIYNVNGTANQITVTPAGNNTGNNSVTVSLPSSVNVSTLNVLNSLNVAGSANFYNTNNLNVSSNIIYYGEGNTGNTLDLGLVTHFVGNLYNGQNKYQHTGLVRKAGQNSPSIWTLFSGLTTEPGDVNSGINWSDPYLTLDTLSANVLGNLSGSYVTVGGGNSNQWNSAYASTTALNTNFSKLSTQAYSLNVNNNILPSYTGNSFTGNVFSFGTQTNAILAGTGNNIMVAESDGGHTDTTVILNGTNNYTSVNSSTIKDSILFGNGNKLNTDSGYSGLFTSIIGGFQNTTSNSGYKSAISNTFNFGANNIICTASDGNSNIINNSNILGSNNSICASNSIAVNNSNILGGNNKICNLSNVYILGSNIAASCANYTYVNNLSSQGSINALGGNSNQWNSVYTTVNANSATSWSYQGTDLKALSGNWQSTYNTVSSLSANWNSAYQSTTALNTTFSKLSSQAYTYNTSTSSVVPSIFKNTNSGVYNIILGGANNSTLGSSNALLNTFSSTVTAVTGHCDASSAAATFGTPPYISTNNIIGGGNNNRIYGCAIATGYYDPGPCTTIPIAGCSIVKSNSIINGCNNLITQPKSTLSSYYTVPATYAGTVSILGNTIINGCSNNIGSCFSTITNGLSNIACIGGNHAFIGSGICNTTSGIYNIVGAGRCNTSSGNYSSIINGACNIASSSYSTIVGGCKNNTNGLANTFILGSNIKASCANFTYVNNLSSGGKLYGDGTNITNVQNIIFTTQDNSSLSAPISNIARNIKPACYSNSNIDSGYYSSIITAGTNNCLCGGATYGDGRGSYGNHHIIIGGNSNLICHTDFCGSAGFDYNTIGNGGSNKIIGTSSGYYNSQICHWVGSYYGSSNNSIINGNCNVIKAVGITNSGTYLNNYSSIINGVCNCIQTGTSNDASYSSIIGGCKNSIYGTYNTIAGGCNNALSGTNSFILGSNIKTNISNYTLVNNLSSQGILGGNNLTLANATLSSTLINPLTAGPLLILNINGVNRAIQLWDFTT